MSYQNCEPDILLYIGSVADTRTSLAIARLPVSPRTVIFTTNRGGIEAFRDRYFKHDCRSKHRNVVPLFPALGPNLKLQPASLDELYGLQDVGHMFFESIPTRPANVLRTISQVLQLSRLKIATRASIAAGIFAATPSEAMIFEQCLMDIGLHSRQIIGGWLNGLGNVGTRIVRFSAASMINQCEIHLPELYRDLMRVTKLDNESLSRGVRL